jgi:hypothetical protein
MGLSEVREQGAEVPRERASGTRGATKKAASRSTRTARKKG